MAKTGTFANFWQARSSCHRALCSTFISPMFPCLCWGLVLSKHLRSAVAATIIHSILFLLCFYLLCFYFGFVRKPKA